MRHRGPPMLFWARVGLCRIGRPDAKRTYDAQVSSRGDFVARRRRLVVVLAALIVLELFGGAAALQRGYQPKGGSASSAGATSSPSPRIDARPTAPGSGGAVASTPAAAARVLLARRADAVLHHDRAAFLSTVDPGQPALRTTQGRLFDSLAKVPLSAWSYRLDPSSGLSVTGARLARYHGEVWAAEADLSYALRGGDPTPTDRPQYLTFVRRGRSWYYASEDDFAAEGKPSWRGIWDYGPVVVARTPDSLVLAHPAHAHQAAALAQDVQQAIPEVNAVWGTGWARRVVTLLPDSVDEMTRLIGGNLDLAHIAAVATADYTDPDSGVVRGQRVVVNPTTLATLGTVAGQVVLRHEITHVATRAETGAATPTWLAEGFADYVGYRNSGVPVHLAARDLRAEVRAGTLPLTLPAYKDFSGANPRLSAVYQESWMACRLIARDAGEAGLVRFYRLVGRGAGNPIAVVDRALRAVLGIGYDDFVVSWRADLASELS